MTRQHNPIQQFAGEVLGALGGAASLLQKPEVLAEFLLFALQIGLDPKRELTDDMREAMQRFALRIRREHGNG